MNEFTGARTTAAWLRPAVVATLVIVSACSYSIIRHGELNHREARRIERGISELRELPLHTAVPMEVKSTAELQSYLQEQIERQYSAKELAGLGRVYTKLGLLAENVDLGQALLKLYTAQVAGFYDPRAGKLFLVDAGLPSGGWLMGLLELVLRRDLVGEMILAHELTHALQDQNFSVLALADDPSNEDRALAVSAVVEGDATLAGFAYVFGGLPTQSLLDVVQRLQAIPAELAASLPETPPALRESLVFRYTAGANFIAWAYLHGGWTAVDAVLAHPPTSSEQLLWPEKYYVTPDDPTEVQLGGLEPYRASSEWELVEENTLGELMIRVLAQQFFDHDRAIETARGWDGDRFVALARGEDLRVYWMSIWDGEQHARRFYEAEREILARLYPSEAQSAAEERASAAGANPYCLERRDKKVLLVFGVPPEQCAAAAEPVWSKTVFVSQPIPLDLDLALAKGRVPLRRDGRPGHRHRA